MNLIVMFIVLSIINVIFSTIRTITTVKSGKFIASVISGGYFAFYNIMIIYTVMDFPLWEKCVITFVCNVIGVFVVKLVEQKMKKDKLWKVEVTIPTKEKDEIDLLLKDIPHSYIKISEKHTLFSFFCEKKEDTKKVKEICEKFNGKFFASENKMIF